MEIMSVFIASIDHFDLVFGRLTMMTDLSYFVNIVILCYFEDDFKLISI